MDHFGFFCLEIENFFHKHPPSLAVLRSMHRDGSLNTNLTPTEGRISRTVSSPTHSLLTGRILSFFDQYTDDESLDSFRTRCTAKKQKSVVTRLIFNNEPATSYRQAMKNLRF